jgi:hypothetical protein
MAEEFKGLNKETLKNVESIKSSMLDIAKATASANKSLQDTDAYLAAYQSSYSAINSSANKFSQIQFEASKSAKATTDAFKEQQKQLSVVRSINAQIDNLYQSMTKASEEEVRLIRRQVENLSSARDNAKELAGVYNDLLQDSSKLDKSTMWFSALSEVVKDIPGLRKLSSPFEAASKAARETVISNAKIKSVNEDIKKLGEEALKTGKGLTKEKLKQLGLDEITQGKSGVAAAAVLKQYQSQAKVQNSTMVGLKSGFSELGPLISSALGPLALLSAAVSAVKFFVSAMFAVDKQTVSLGRNLQISNESATQLRKYFLESSQSSKDLAYTTEDMVEAQMQLSQLSATSNLYSQDQLKAQIEGTKYLKLSVEEVSSLNKFSIAYGKNSKDIYDSASATVTQYQKQNKILFRAPEILKQASKISGELLLSFKGSEKALFGAIMNANKLGVSLEKSKDISNSLLNFEESISAELEAELLTGKDFNLDLARSLALQGDFVGATEAALSNIHSISEFEQMNVLARKASAKALGMTVDELSDALIQQELIRNGQKEQYDRFLEFGDKRAAQQLLEGKLDKEAIEAANKRLDAEERFGIQLNKAKETFTSFVENGTLQNLADIVEKLVNYLSGGENLANKAAEEDKKIAAMKEGEDKVKTIQANMQRKMEADEALQSKTDLKMTAQGAGLGLGLMLVGAALSATGIGAPIGVPMMAAGAAGGAAIGYGTSKLLPNKYEYETPQVNQMSNTSGNTNSDIMLKSILNMKQNPTPIYLDNTKLNSATAMGSYELNKGTTGSGR